MPFKDPDKTRKYQRNYRKKNAKKLGSYFLAYRLAHPEKAKAWKKTQNVNAKYKKRQRTNRKKYSKKRVDEAMEVLMVINFCRWKSYLKKVPDRKLQWAQLQEDLEDIQRMQIAA